MKKNILVTGPPGCGKSTLIAKIVEGIKTPACGFLTGEIRERGRRVGFQIETLAGEKGILAHIETESRVRVGKYGVRIDVLEAMAVPSLHADSADALVVIDEIGKMECFSPLFKSAVLKVLASPNPVLASIAARGDSFIEGIKSRDDIILHRISAANRDDLAVSILDELKAAISENRVQGS